MELNVHKWMHSPSGWCLFTRLWLEHMISSLDIPHACFCSNRPPSLHWTQPSFPSSLPLLPRLSASLPGTFPCLESLFIGKPMHVLCLKQNSWFNPHCTKQHTHTNTQKSNKERNKQSKTVLKGTKNENKTNIKENKQKKNRMSRYRRTGLWIFSQLRSRHWKE